jgi:multicomponent Na+:H+ antiporter subunit G
MSVRDVVAWVLVGVGVGAQVFVCLGVLLMRDALDRLHYTGALTAAALLVGAAVLVRESFSLIGDRAIIVAVLVLVTNPVLTHATGRALHRRRVNR